MAIESISTCKVPRMVPGTEQAPMNADDHYLRPVTACPGRHVLKPLEGSEQQGSTLCMCCILERL